MPFCFSQIWSISCNGKPLAGIQCWPNRQFSSFWWIYILFEDYVYTCLFAIDQALCHLCLPCHLYMMSEKQASLLKLILILSNHIFLKEKKNYFRENFKNLKLANQIVLHDWYVLHAGLQVEWLVKIKELIWKESIKSKLDPTHWGLLEEYVRYLLYTLAQIVIDDLNHWT